MWRFVNPLLCIYVCKGRLHAFTFMYEYRIYIWKSLPLNRIIPFAVEAFEDDGAWHSHSPIFPKRHTSQAQHIVLLTRSRNISHVLTKSSPSICIYRNPRINVQNRKVVVIRLIDWLMYKQGITFSLPPSYTSVAVHMRGWMVQQWMKLKITCQCDL